MALAHKSKRSSIYRTKKSNRKPRKGALKLALSLSLAVAGDVKKEREWVRWIGLRSISVAKHHQQAFDCHATHSETESRPFAKHLLSSGDKAGMKYNYSEFIPPHGGKAPFMALRLAVKSAMAKILALTLRWRRRSSSKRIRAAAAECLLLHLIIIKRTPGLKSWMKFNSFCYIMELFCAPPVSSKRAAARFPLCTCHPRYI